MATENARGELILIHIGERPPAFDLEAFAHDELERAKESLREEGYLTAICWIVCASEIHVYAVGFQNVDEKYEVYARLVERARQLPAEAIIMLNDTRFVDNADVQYYPGMTTYPGELSFEGAKEAVTVLIAGPNIESKQFVAKYQRIGNKIVFAPTEEFSDVTVGLVGSWSREIKGIQ